MKSKELKDIIGKMPTPSDEEGRGEPTAKPKGNEVVTFALTEEDKERVREKARQAVAAKFKKRAEELYLQQTIKELEQELIPEQKVEPILINVAGHADKITLDGRQYVHGRIYMVTKSERETIEEIMSRTWQHEHEVNGANFNHYRKPTNVIIHPGSEHTAMIRV